MRCPYCGKSFKTKVVYDAHVEGHEYEINKEIVGGEEEEEEEEEVNMNEMHNKSMQI